VAYPTTDIPIRCLPRLEALWRERLFPAVEAEARTRLGIGSATRLWAPSVGAINGHNLVGRGSVRPR
jgi:hypothetical protein